MPEIGHRRAPILCPLDLRATDVPGEFHGSKLDVLRGGDS